MHSLQTELGSLKSYRDTLHDTMKGLIESAKGQLGDGEPTLLTNLQLVAAALGALTEEKQSNRTADDAQLRREHEALMAHCRKQEEALSAAGAELSRLKAEREAMLIDRAEDARLQAQQARLAELAAQRADKQVQEKFAQAARRAECQLAAMEAEAAKIDVALTQEAARRGEDLRKLGEAEAATVAAGVEAAAIRRIAAEAASTAATAQASYADVEMASRATADERVRQLQRE
eukprot:4360180-Prymnesium_polylepis.1